MEIRLSAIGIISTDHTSKELAPVQGVFRPEFPKQYQPPSETFRMENIWS